MNRGTGGVQASLIPPLAAIERIEVVRGPMSSLYGSDAMGGVINIITRKVPERLSASVMLGGIVQEDGRYGNSTLGISGSARRSHQIRSASRSTGVSTSGPRTTSFRSEEQTSELQSLMRISYAVL